MDDLPCPHRSDRPIGTINCGCGGRRNVYRCTEPTVNQLVTRHAAAPRHKDVRLFERDSEGRRAIKLPSLSLPACVLCRQRPGTPPELLALGKDLPANPSEPASERDPCLQAAIEAICAACPRLNAKGERFECPGATAAGCPLSLWPVIQDPKSRRGGGCRGCG